MSSQGAKNRNNLNHLEHHGNGRELASAFQLA